MANEPRGAIVGLGVTPMGKIYGRRAVDFAAEAIALALDDAGLTKSDVDGLLINANIPNDMDPRAQMALGFENLTLINVMNGYGSTAGAMMQYACMAIREGLAKTVVLVHEDGLFGSGLAKLMQAELPKHGFEILDTIARNTSVDPSSVVG